MMRISRVKLIGNLRIDDLASINNRRGMEILSVFLTETI